MVNQELWVSEHSAWNRLLVFTCSILFVGLLGVGCLANKSNSELGPIFFNREVPDTGGREGAVLWPFFQWQSAPSVRQYALRPLVNLRWENEVRPDAKTEIQALWPLFLYRKKADEFRIRVFPIFHYTDYLHPDGTRDVHWALVPLVFGGRSHREGSYFALFPLGGVVKRILGKDWIQFIMFPLYAHAKDGEHRSWNVLWPIFQYGHGGTRTSYRIWPLLGRKSKEDAYHREFLLWPLVIHEIQKQSPEHLTNSWYFIPFYGHEQTPFGNIYYWLFPFFSYQRNERPGNRFREWNAPYPFFALAKGDRYNKLYFFPFWGKNVLDQFETRFGLFPIYWSFAEKTKTTQVRRYWVLPFYWSLDRRLPPSEGGRTRTLKIWPFMDYEKTDEIERVRLFSPLWFRDPAGFERNYSVFWQWYNRTEYYGNEVSLRVLWFYRYKASHSDLKYKAREDTAPRGYGVWNRVLDPLATQGRSEGRDQEQSFMSGEGRPREDLLLDGIADW